MSKKEYNEIKYIAFIDIIRYNSVSLSTIFVFYLRINDLSYSKNMEVKSWKIQKKSSGMV